MRTRIPTLHHRRSRSNARQPVRALADHAGASDVGRRREVNQDAFLSTGRLWAVADGVGGGPAGEVAARIAIEALERGAPGAHSARDLERLAQDAAAHVHAAGRADRARAGMATTLTAALLTADGLAVVHAGDSRLYRLRAGRLERLTVDHALVDQLVREGLLTPERAATHPLRNMITRALGRDPDVDYDRLFVAVEPGDVFLLCTDGLTKMVGEPVIAATIDGASSLEEAALELVHAANAAGGRDNVTVVLAAAPAAVTAVAA
jgi:PPM family protein phosphatase